jgi:endonuclease YncB( thermonuclease family)
MVIALMILTMNRKTQNKSGWFGLKGLVAGTALLVSLVTAGAATLTGKVVGVSDGDTITVLDAAKTQHKIRLAGIDPPEKAQPFGQKSKEHLSDSVFGKQVQVEYTKTDKYGRTVGKVLVNGMDANLEQIKAGFAWHYKEYAAEQPVADRATYASAETTARSASAGLWRDAKPMPPWEWRHGGKNEPTTESSASGCACGGTALCTGKRGGQYCIAPNGKKKYS